jgi:hypothetical protein
MRQDLWKYLTALALAGGLTIGVTVSDDSGHTIRIRVPVVAPPEHIPLSLGATDGNCNVTRRGIITHWMGGPCSGGHVDIRPYSITGVIGQIRRLQVSSLDRLRCSRLNAWRAAGRPVAGTHAAVLRKRTLEAHHVICEPGKPARRA